jgi:hypothetical protein
MTVSASAFHTTAAALAAITIIKRVHRAHMHLIIVPIRSPAMPPSSRKSAFGSFEPAAGRVHTAASTFAAAADADDEIHLLLSHLRFRHCQDCRHHY